MDTTTPAKIEVFYAINTRDICFIDDPNDAKLDVENYKFVTKVDPKVAAENSHGFHVSEGVYRVMNVVDGSPFELPRQLRCRSLSVGDIVVVDGEAHFCARAGFEVLKDAEFVKALLGKSPTV